MRFSRLPILSVCLLTLVFCRAYANDPFAHPADWLPTPQNYLSGHQICEKFAAADEPVHGYIEVPIDYGIKNSSKTPIYYWLEREFEPTKATVVYFKGGPGGGNHGSFRYSSLLGDKYNVIYFDQRGVKCSRPVSLQVAMDPNFYSSEFTARDAQELLNHFGVRQAIVFGNSYGSVPPTVFANLFPERTLAVILEGVAYDGASMWEASSFWKIVQLWLDRQTTADITFIESLPTKYGVAETWFADSLRSYSYMNDDLEKADWFLAQIKKDPSLIQPVVFAPGNWEDHELTLRDQYLNGQDPLDYYEISCREFAKGNPELASTFKILHGKLISMGNPEAPMCSYLGVPTQPEHNYLASHYPIVAPTTYFQGTYDGATEVSGAIRHFKTVPQGFKQMFLRKHGGHGPFTMLLFEHQEAGQLLFNAAAEGRPLTKEDLSALRKVDPSWVTTTGGRGTFSGSK